MLLSLLCHLVSPQVYFSSSLPLVPGVGGRAPGSGGCAAGDPTTLREVPGLLPDFGLSWIDADASAGRRANITGVVPAAVALSLSSAAFNLSSSALSSDAWLLTMRFLGFILELKGED